MGEFERSHATSFNTGTHEVGVQHDQLKADAAAVKAAGAAAVHRMASWYSGNTPQQVQKMSLGEKIAHAIAFGIPDLAEDIINEVVGALLVAIPLYIALHFSGVGEAVDIILTGFAWWGKGQAILELIRFFLTIWHAKNEDDLRTAGAHLARAVKDYGIAKMVKALQGMAQTMSKLHGVGDAKLIGHAAERANDISGQGYDNVAHPLEQQLGLVPSHRFHR